MKPHLLLDGMTTPISAASSVAAVLTPFAREREDQTNDYVKVVIVTDIDPTGVGNAELNIQVRCTNGRFGTAPTGLGDQFIYTTVSSSLTGWNAEGWQETAAGNFAIVFEVPRFPWMGLAVAATASSTVSIIEGWIIE